MTIHEVGHLWALPLESEAHLSFSHPCLLCDGTEGSQSSLAHTGYSEDFELPPIENMVYTLAGGAAEIASGLPRVTAMFELGEFPASMENDLIDFRDLFVADTWLQLKALGSQILDPLVSYFDDHASRLWKLQGVVRENRSATARVLNLDKADHGSLMAAFEKALNPDTE